MSDEKDRFGEKLHDVEKAREDQWARERDRELLEKLRTRRAAAGDLHCLQCQAQLVPQAANGMALMACPNGHGAWLDAESLRHVTKG